MAICWSWAFGPESDAEMLDLGWEIWNSNVSKDSSASRVYSYIGSPTRSSAVRSSGTAQIRPPIESGVSWASTNAGCVSVPIKRDGVSVASGASDVIRVYDPASNRIISVRTVNGSPSLSLYVDSVFQEATPALDLSVWKYVTLKWDMSTSTWKGQIFVDGVAATLEQTDARSIALNPYVDFGYAGSTSNPWCIGQIILWDAYADTAETPYFVTRVNPNADGTNVGTWTPSTGSDDYAVVAGPYDDTTYTEEATPTASDQMEVLTNAASATIDTQLGIVSGSVQAVTLHTNSVGQSITARAIIRDGPTAASADAASGETKTIDPTNSTYATATATQKSGGAWAGTDAPAFVYEVVTV